MAGFENDVMIAKNVNFDGAAAKPHLGIINAAGKLPIGTGNVSPTPEILGGSLTSPDSSITVGYSSPNITLEVNTSVITDLHTAKFIVGDLANGANYSTIASALTAAASGDTVFLQTGTYTENLTLKAGVNLAAFSGDGDTPTVTIIGKATLTTAGTVSISNTRLQTNSDFFLAVTGSENSIVNLENCYLNITNNTGISYTSSGTTSGIRVQRCMGNVGTTGISLFAASGSGALAGIASAVLIKNCYLSNTGASTTPSTTSACNVTIEDSSLLIPFSTSSTGGLIFFRSELGNQNENAIVVTTAGTGGVSAEYCGFAAGSGSGLSIGAGTTANLYGCVISSSNTNAITGAGTINYSNIIFNNASSVMNVTTQNGFYTQLGKYKASAQPCFSAYLGTSTANATGDGTAYTIPFNTEIVDQGNNYDNTTGIFTAPVTGNYFFTYTIYYQSNLVTNVTQGQILNSFGPFTVNVASVTGNVSVAASCIVRLSASDTCSVRAIISGGAKTVTVYGAGGDPRTAFSGYLLG